MNRRRITGHDATHVNPEWRLEHVTGPEGIDEYSLDVGEEWLVFDPREQADREQLKALIGGLQAALGSPVRCNGWPA